MGVSKMLQSIDDRPQLNNYQPAQAVYSTVPYQVTTEQALDAYIKADGNVHLAAERCYGNNHSVAAYMDLLSQDYISLQRLLRTRTLLNLFTTYETAQKAMATALPLMENDDLAKTYVGIVGILEKMTSQSQNVSINIHEYMMRQLPPEVRDALSILTAPPESVIKLSDD